MLCVLFVILSIGSCHSYTVSVTVLDGFCLDMYPNDPANTNAQSQLQLQFRVGYGAMQTESLYYETDFKTFTLKNPSPQISFTKGDNILLGSIIPSLVLGKAIPLRGASQQDDLDIRFDINPVIKQNADGSKADKCPTTGRIHHQAVLPSSLLQNVTTQTFSAPIVLDLSKTTCLTSTDQSWFTCQPRITVQLDLNCGGPCYGLFTTTAVPISAGNQGAGVVALIMVVVIAVLTIG